MNFGVMILVQIFCLIILTYSNSCIFNLNSFQPFDILYQTLKFEIHFVHVLICGIGMFFPYENMLTYAHKTLCKT
jgi:hypothetical protein